MCDDSMPSSNRNGKCVICRGSPGVTSGANENFSMTSRISSGESTLNHAGVYTPPSLLFVHGHCGATKVNIDVADRLISPQGHACRTIGGAAGANRYVYRLRLRVAREDDIGRTKHMIMGGNIVEEHAIDVKGSEESRVVRIVEADRPRKIVVPAVAAAATSAR